MWSFYQTLTLYFFILLLGVVGLLSIYYKNAFVYWKKKNVPFLAPSFPFGNMSPNFATYIGQNIAEIYHKMKQKGHKYCGYYLFGSPVFMPLSLEMMKHFLITDFRCFSDRGLHLNEKNDPMGSNIATLSGDKWKRWKEKLSPMFTSQKTKIMLPIVMKCTGELELVFEEYIKNDTTLPIQDIAKRYTVDVICGSAFGVESNCLKDPESDFFKHANMIITRKIKDSLRILIGISAPILSQIFNIQLFNPTASEFFRRIVRETVTHREQNNIERPDFLNLMIRLKNEFSENGVQEKKITDDEIAAQCFIFFLGGMETSASALSFCFYELSANPDVQHKLRQEILETKEEINYESVGKLPYLDMVFKETLRKYPSVHMLNRVVSQDFNIPGTQTVIKKGTMAVLSTIGLHRDPEYFPNPDKFDPERFSNENKDKIPHLAFLPFGDGPRICPGMRFGIMEFKICLVRIVAKYQFILDPKMKDPPKLCSLANVLGTTEPIYLKVVENNI